MYVVAPGFGLMIWRLLDKSLKSLHLLLVLPPTPISSWHLFKGGAHMHDTLSPPNSQVVWGSLPTDSPEGFP